MVVLTVTVGLTRRKWNKNNKVEMKKMMWKKSTGRR